MKQFTTKALYDVRWPDAAEKNTPSECAEGVPGGSFTR